MLSTCHKFTVDVEWIHSEIMKRVFCWLQMCLRKDSIDCVYLNWIGLVLCCLKHFVGKNHDTRCCYLWNVSDHKVFSFCVCFCRRILSVYRVHQSNKTFANVFNGWVSDSVQMSMKHFIAVGFHIKQTVVKTSGRPESYLIKYEATVTLFYISLTVNEPH